MAQIIISDTDTLLAWSTVYPDLEDVVLPDSLVSIVYPSEDEEALEGRVQSLVDQHLNDSIPETRFLIYNALSTQWTFTKFQKNPIAYPFLYFFGMIAYSVALPIRVAIFAYSLIRWVMGPITILCCGRSENFYEEMKARSIIVLGAFGEVVSGTIGVVCPPLAYAFDEWIQAHTTIHTWYSSHRLSVWSDEVASSNENEERVAQKKEAVKEDVKYFKRAKEDLANRYLSAESEVDSMSPAALQLIMHFGFLDLFCSYCHTEISPPHAPITLEALTGTPLAQYCTNALEACQEDAVRINTQEGLLGSIEKFRMYWLACCSKKPAHELWGYLATAAQVATQSPRGKEKADEFCLAIKAVLLLNLGASVTFNEENTQEGLQAALERVEDIQLVVNGEKITGKEAVTAMANAIQKFSGTIKSTDREMEGVILRNVYGD